MRQAPLALLAAGTVILLSITDRSVAQTAVNWTSTGGAPWGTAANWTPSQVPNNVFPSGPFYIANINQAGPTLNMNVSLAGLSVNDTVTYGPSGFLSFDSADHNTFISGNGSITIQPGTGNQSLFLAGNSSLTMSGSGSILMGGAGLARIAGNAGATLDNTGWRIVGEGNLIEGFVAMSNAGTIIASGGTMNLAAAGIVNTKTISAVTGGTLVINGGFGSINNVGGTIHADGGLIQLFNGLLISDGALSTANGGTIQSMLGGAGVVTLDGVTNSGNFLVSSGNLDLTDTIVNSGSFTVTGAMRALNTATLSGGGTINMAPGSVFLASGGSAALVNSNNTIRGAGQLGSDQLEINNLESGVILASGGTLTINPNASGMANYGVMEAVNGGTLVLSGQGGGSFVNANGTIDSGEGHVVLSSDVTVSGGTIESTGIFGDVSVPQLQTAHLENVTIAGRMIGKSGSIVDMQGFVAGGGMLEMDTGSRGLIRGEMTLSLSQMAMQLGSVLQGEPVPPPAPGAGPPIGTPELINNGLIAGAGTLSADTLKITNNGTITGNVDVSGVAQPLWINPDAEGLTNAQFIQADDLGAVVLDGTNGGVFTQTPGGTIRALGNGNVRLQGNAFITGGQFGSGGGSISLLSGSSVIENLTSDANFVQSGGTTLTINGDVVNTGTITTAGAANLIVAGSATLNSSSGYLVNNGSITINAAGLLDADFLVGTGRVTVLTNGTLHIHSITQGSLAISNNSFAALKTSFVPSADPSRVNNLSIGSIGASLDMSDRVMIVDYSGGGSTTFNTIRSQIASGYNNGAWNGTGINSSSAAGNPGHGLGYAEAAALSLSSFDGVPVDSTAVLIKYTYAGDSNLDGQVDVTDLGALATNWQSSADWIGGDFNYNGFVDVTDLGALATNWQQGVGNPLGPGSLQAALAAVGLGGVDIPEGGTSAFVFMLITPALCRRRIRR